MPLSSSVETMGEERGRGEFRVRVTRKEVVAAEVPTQEYWLPLSNLDLLLPPLDVSLFLCYRKPHESSFSFGSMVRVLKESMAMALVPYYAFGGEVFSNSAGEPELLCNNRGVDFLEAYADVRLRDLNFYDPDRSIQAKLVPDKKHGVLSVQVTELKCGGVVVACTFDHRIADAYSSNMFLVSWAEMSQNMPLSVVPSFRRSLLSPRRPGSYHSSIDDMYVPYSALPPPPPPPSPGELAQQYPTDDRLISRLFYVPGEQLSRLQTLATTKGSSSKRTKLVSLSAFLWKKVAEGSTINAAAAKMCKMGIVVDGRQRLGGNMASFFGNVLSIPFGEKTLGELTAKPLSWVADAIQDYLDGAATKEHFLGLIDWVEAHRPVRALTKIYCSSGEPALVMSSGQRFAVAKVDFGWGKPALGSYHFPWGGETGYVMPMPSPVLGDDWVVYMLLLKTQMEFIEKEASNVFRPLTSEYLKL